MLALALAHLRPPHFDAPCQARTAWNANATPKAQNTKRTGSAVCLSAKAMMKIMAARKPRKIGFISRPLPDHRGRSSGGCVVGVVDCVDVVEAQIHTQRSRERDQPAGAVRGNALSPLVVADVSLGAADPVSKHLLRDAQALTYQSQVVHPQHSSDAAMASQQQCCFTI